MATENNPFYAKQKRFFKNLSLGTAGLSLSLTANAKNTRFEVNPLDNLPLNPSEDDWNKIRNQFILNSEKIYLNNGTMGVSPLAVISKTEERMRQADIEGLYGGEEMALESIAKFINADKDEIGLTHNVTEGTNIALFGLNLKKGSRIICTTHEHAGTAFPLLWLAKKNKLKIRAVDIDIKPEITTANILNAIDSKTSLICIPHMPCTTGQLLDVERICTEARKRNIITLIDGAHPPGMIRVDVKKIDCDIYVSCGHKWMLGPKGTGFMYVRKEMLPKINLVFVGAGTHQTWKLGYNSSELGEGTITARKFFFGSQNAGLYEGMKESIHFLTDFVGMENVENRTRGLSQYAKTLLSQEVKGIRFYCPDDLKYRTGVTSFKIEGTDSQFICNSLRENKIIVRHVHENNLDLVRVSTHIYNSKKDCENMVEVVKKIIKQ